MRHGFGVSRCRHTSGGLEVEADVFVHASDPVKIVALSVTNRGPSPRRLAITSYQRLVLGASPADRGGADHHLGRSRVGHSVRAPGAELRARRCDRVRGGGRGRRPARAVGNGSRPGAGQGREPETPGRGERRPRPRRPHRHRIRSLLLPRDPARGRPGRDAPLCVPARRGEGRGDRDRDRGAAAGPQGAGVRARGGGVAVGRAARSAAHRDAGRALDLPLNGWLALPDAGVPAVGARRLLPVGRRLSDSAISSRTRRR